MNATSFALSPFRLEMSPCVEPTFSTCEFARSCSAASALRWAATAFARFASRLARGAQAAEPLVLGRGRALVRIACALRDSTCRAPALEPGDLEARGRRAGGRGARSPSGGRPPRRRCRARFSERHELAGERLGPGRRSASDPAVSPGTTKSEAPPAGRFGGVAPAPPPPTRSRRRSPELPRLPLRSCSFCSELLLLVARARRSAPRIAAVFPSSSSCCSCERLELVPELLGAASSALTSSRARCSGVERRIATASTRSPSQAR